MSSSSQHCHLPNEQHASHFAPVSSVLQPQSCMNLLPASPLYSAVLPLSATELTTTLLLISGHSSHLLQLFPSHCLTTLCLIVQVTITVRIPELYTIYFPPHRPSAATRLRLQHQRMFQPAVRLSISTSNSANHRLHPNLRVASKRLASTSDRSCPRVD